MKSRRIFLKNALLSGGLTASGFSALWTSGCGEVVKGEQASQILSKDIDPELVKAAFAKPVLKKELFPDPVMIDSIDLIKIGGEFVVRARDPNGAEGYAVTNWGIAQFYPIFVSHVAPFFVGKDARNLDQIIDDCFIADSHYKMQSMAILTPIASAELAVLDLLGQVIQQPLYNMLGELVRPEVEIYWANNFRGQSAEDSVRQILERYERERPPAVKFKIAGRMGTPEVPVGRTEKMIPLLREKLGDDVVIYADANGGYNVEEAIRIGKILEEHNIGFFEEPCPFYNLWETKEVADNLSIPIAAGEQESSSRRFRWMIEQGAAQIVQPDLFYYGGMIRSIRVARMAEAAGLMCTPHVSGGGVNMLYITHFASMLPNAGPHQEYKTPNKDIQYEILGGHIQNKAGKLKAPTGSGLGCKLDPEWINTGKVITRNDLI